TLAQGAIHSTVDDLAIQGPGQSLLSIDGANADRIFVHTGIGTLAISDLAVTHGYLSGDYNGGCVRSYGNLDITRSRVSDCVVAAISYAAGGGVAARANLTLIDSTITANTVTTANNYYGYLYGGGANAVGELVVTRSTISGNQITFTGTYSPYSIGYGGGVNARADVTITASTIDGNTSASFGGGLFIAGHDHLFSRLAIVNSTVSGNAAGNAGGGVSVGGLFRTYLGSVVLHSSTIARNTAAVSGGGVHFRDYVLVDAQSIIVASNAAPAQADLNADESLAIYGADNLIMEATATVALPADTLRGDPLLLDLADNGGPTRTHALAADSPAIDAGNNYFELDSDQRGDGHSRVVGGRADIGAYEVGEPATPDLIFADGFDPAAP
ncbi:MAG TPA: choice-of-anchor Q domain-containing protein, partial [Dokdonella sp.]